MPLSVSGVFAFLGHWTVILAFKYEKGGRVAAVRYTMIIYGLAVDWLHYRIPIAWTDIVGALLIGGSFLLVAYLRGTNKIR